MLAWVASETSAQTMVWEMHSTECNSLTRVTNNLYMLEKNGKKGLVTSKGVVVVDAVCSDITPFYENWALLLSKEGGKERVVGCVNTEGRCNVFDKTYYALAGQLFYSDGLLTVEDEKGRKGYIDERGVEVEKTFKGNYDNIRPFTEGYAAVFKNQKYDLIDKTGQKERIIIGIGEVYGGTNVFKDEAYVWDTEGKLYTYNINTKTCKKTSKKPASMQIDYLFCFSAISGRGKEVAYSKPNRGQLGLTPVEENGRMGYAMEGMTLLTPQFEHATQMEDGRAVVGANGQYGIIKLVENAQPWTVTPVEGKLEYLDGEQVLCRMMVNIPEPWREHDIQVKVNCHGLPLQGEGSGEGYAFYYAPHGAQQDFDVEIVADGLNVLRQKVAYEFKKKVLPLNIDIVVLGQQADTNGKVYVNAVVTNPNSTTVSATITINGGNAPFQSKSQQMVIPPAGSVTLSSCFCNINKAFANQYVSVTTSTGTEKRKGGISLRPTTTPPPPPPPPPPIL